MSGDDARDGSDRASDQGRFAAREFVARWTRETGEQPSAVVTDRMLFAYEMGYLRGRGDGALQMFTTRVDMQGAGDRASEEGKIVAREFVARWTREIAEQPSAVVTDRMLFAYEMGYLRGRSDAGRDALRMMDKRKGSDADSE